MFSEKVPAPALEANVNRVKVPLASSGPVWFRVMAEFALSVRVPPLNRLVPAPLTTPGGPEIFDLLGYD